MMANDEDENLAKSQAETRLKALEVSMHESTLH
jgi:hypothetical protein